jgi:hypothetical protein
VDDVVHLAVLLDAAPPDVRVARRVAVEPAHVHFADVHRRDALDDPLRHELADATAVRDPHGLGQPEALDIG